MVVNSSEDKEGGGEKFESINKPEKLNSSLEGGMLN
jgi:hypothetical protein